MAHDVSRPETDPAVRSARDRLSSLDATLSDPEVLRDPTALRRLSRERAGCLALVDRADHCARLAEDLAAARELAGEDPSFGEEATRLGEELGRARGELVERLAPGDPLDQEDCLLEVISGEGGEESALFAANLTRMYRRWSESKGWTVTELDAQPTDLGGLRSVVLAVRAGHGEGSWASLKFEGGVHRVQRVPVTEAQGRIHTSAVGVLVSPDVAEDQVELDLSQVRVDVFRSSGPGGQGVNTTDSAVRLTHLPTGIVVSCQNERSQLQNKEQAMRMLRARLAAVEAARRAEEVGSLRREQVRTVDRSARIRTYNFSENRLTDHRIGFKSHHLDEILGGDLDELVAALRADDVRRRLAAAGSQEGR